jgi:hypothetical protein
VHQQRALHVGQSYLWVPLWLCIQQLVALLQIKCGISGTNQWVEPACSLVFRFRIVLLLGMFSLSAPIHIDLVNAIIWHSSANVTAEAAGAVLASRLLAAKFRLCRRQRVISHAEYSFAMYVCFFDVTQFYNIVG